MDLHFLDIYGKMKLTSCAIKEHGEMESLQHQQRSDPLKRKTLCGTRTSFMQVIVTVSLKYLISCPAPKIKQISFIFSVEMWNSLQDSSLIVFS